jgi:hypothetical protein
MRIELKRGGSARMKMSQIREWFISQDLRKRPHDTTGIKIVLIDA